MYTQIHQDWEHLLSPAENSYHISILTQTQRSGKARYFERDMIQFKNNLKDATSILVKKGMEEEEVKRLLSPANDLLNGEDFWKHQLDGLAVYLNNGNIWVYKLPVPIENMSYIADHFYILPLVSFRHLQPQYYILALSQQSVKLFVATQYHIEKSEIQNKLPSNIEDTERNTDRQNSLQHHSVKNSRTGGTIFHGQGGEKDYKKIAVERYLREVNNGITQSLKDEKKPLLVASVDELFSIYKQLNDYPYLLQHHIRGNFDEVTFDELHRTSLEAMKGQFQGEKDRDISRFHVASNQNKAVFGIEEIIALAFQGRIETLFIKQQTKIWGSFTSELMKAEVHEQRTKESIDLINLSAIFTDKNGGKVYFLPGSEMPFNHSTLAANIRA